MIKGETIAILERLSNANGASGYENNVIEIIKNEIKSYVEYMKVDALGNLITYKKNKKDKPKIMFTAHTDEVALMVTKIEDNGYLRFAPMGTIDERVLVAKKVLVGKNGINGVIGSKAIHLMKEEERNKPVNIEQLSIDIGVKNKEEASKFVKIGEPVYFTTKFEKWGEVLKGKAFDDRMGCISLIELIKDDEIPLSFYAVFSVQEEMGMRGARVAAYRIEPEITIALEGTACGDFPHKKDESLAAQMGKGVVITRVDARTICNRELVDILVNTAKKNNIPYQFRKPGVGATDAEVAQVAKTGSKVAVLAVPCRYIHSPCSLATINDLASCIQIAKQTLIELSS